MWVLQLCGFFLFCGLAQINSSLTAPLQGFAVAVESRRSPVFMSFSKLLSVSLAGFFKHYSQSLFPINHINFVLLFPQVIFHMEYQCIGRVKTMKLLSPFWFDIAGWAAESLPVLQHAAEWLETMEQGRNWNMQPQFCANSRDICETKCSFWSTGWVDTILTVIFENCLSCVS